jgi:hypothetical protein
MYNEFFNDGEDDKDAENRAIAITISLVSG